MRRGRLATSNNGLGSIQRGGGGELMVREFEISAYNMPFDALINTGILI
jgi:hypothetical protein